MSGKLVFAAKLALVLLGVSGVTFRAHGVSGKTCAMPDEYRISDVPFVEQEKNWCGPASLTMILNYWGDPINQDEIGSAVDPEHEGTHSQALISFLESRGYATYDFDRYSLEYRSSVMDELKIWVSHDYPVVVSQWTYFSGKSGHYRVIVGYDAESVFVKDPNSGSIAFSTAYFLQLWEMNNEYGLIVIGDTAKDSDSDQLTDLDEVIHNTDPFDTTTRDPFPIWIAALIATIAVAGAVVLVYLAKVKKAALEGRARQSQDPSPNPKLNQT